MFNLCLTQIKEAVSKVSTRHCETFSVEAILTFNRRLLHFVRNDEAGNMLLRQPLFCTQMILLSNHFIADFKKLANAYRD